MSAGKKHPRSAEGFTSVSVAKLTRRMVRKLQHDSRFTGTLGQWSADDVIFQLASNQLRMYANVDELNRLGIPAGKESIESRRRESIEPPRPAPIGERRAELAASTRDRGRTGAP